MATHEVKSTMKLWRWIGALAVLLCASCYQSGEDQEVGGDSHFLRPCKEQTECSDLAGKSCVAGYCRGPGDPTTGDGSTSAPAPSGSAQSNQSSGSPSTEESPLDDSTPLVMLLVDTSGSMERMADCTCETPGCEECLPDCSRGDRNRFTDVLEALTGTFHDFSCETLLRSGDRFTYDAGYYLPYSEPSGTQRNDGLLDDYRDRLRFGLATFDGLDTWVGAAPLVPADEFDFDASASQTGEWSYNPQLEAGAVAADGMPAGAFRYGSDQELRFMDTGIRNARAEQGALQVAVDPRSALQLNDTIQQELLSVRPYGGTPIAAALDDLYYLLAKDTSMAAERAHDAPRHIVLITDGYPDDDYRSFGCDCATRPDPGSDPMCAKASDLSALRCPYPTAEEGARALRCGQDPNSCDAGVVSRVHVVSFADADPAVTTRNDHIAIEGGGQGARHPFDELQLRQQVGEILSEIAQ
jgi:hypothetical protein